MADDVDSDACVPSKRRITEIEETLLRQQEEPSTSISTQEKQDSKESSLIASSPQEDLEIMRDIPSSGSPKKVKCSFTEHLGGSIEENQGMLGKVENLGAQVQVTKNCVVVSVSGVGKSQGEIEGTVNDVMASAKSEVGFFGAEVFDKHGVSDSGEYNGIEVEMGSIFEVKEEFFSKEKTEAETLLEAKKEALLAKLDAGSIIKDKIHVENVPAFNTTTGILGGLKGIDESVSPSLKVEKNEKQEAGGKKAKRPRRKGKDVKKVLEVGDEQKKMTDFDKAASKISQAGEAQNSGQKNGSQIRKYSREEMETLRFVNIVEQRKLWRVICTGLGDAVVKEYNDLAGSRQQKNIHMNFDPRQHFVTKEDAPGILRDVSSENGDNEIENTDAGKVENVNLLDPSCESIGGEDASTFLEEGCSEEEDSDKDYASIQRPAFL
ncbi:hypothetical protein GH714_009476 [Hevea brasiliensis]|uniref:Uncharacterized protein n=1 Tax=Hevea brasiliensis TaxID=3981 RepID=A0A6A6LIP5_HEVBR|nr:hypothetical protein GH714_009476 [Hevea brasiliensis]